METVIFMITWIGGASLHTFLELNLKKRRTAGFVKAEEKVEKPFISEVNGK